MPIWLRKFTLQKVAEHYESQNKKSRGNTVNDMNEARSILQKAQSNDPRTAKSPPQQKPQVNVPDFVTSKGKASKK